MKKWFGFFLIPLSFAACTGSGTGTTPPPGNDSAVTASLPYTADYMTIVPGKPGNLVTVLNSFKAWETNDMAALKATYGDTVGIDFSSGYKFKGSLDSLMKMATHYRDSLAKVDYHFYVWMNSHSVDKNEDWVSVWYKEIDTYKTGKVDSASFEDDHLVKDGKIVYVGSHMQKLSK